MDNIVPINSQNSAPGQAARSTYSKRVAAACDYCRTKRLKCTHDEWPCLNCRLYGAECKNTKGPRLKGGSKKSTKRRAKPNVSENRAIPATVLRESYSEQSTAMPDERMTGAENDSAREIDTFRAKDYSRTGEPLPSWPEGLTNHSLIQDTPIPHDPESSQSDVWRFPVPLHDSQFLDRLVNPSLQVSRQRPLDELAKITHLPSISESSQTAPATPQSLTEDQTKGMVSSVNALQHQGAELSSDEHILPGLFIRLNPVDSGYIGYGSTGATLALCLRESIEHHKDLASEISYDWLVEAGRHITVSPGSLINVSIHDLPPKSLATFCIAAYFSNVHIFYPFVRVHEFQARWGDLYNPTKTEHRSVDYLLFCMIVAVGALSDRALSESTPQLDSFSNALYEKAWSLLSPSLSQPSYGTIQVLFLYTIFMQYNGQGSTASVFCGLFLRLCQALGLHRHSPCDFELSEDEVRYRSQLWWIAFTLEVSLSLSEGRPTSVGEATYDVELLPLCDSTYHTLDTAQLDSNAFHWRVKLAQLQHRLCVVLSRSASAQSKLNALTDLDLTLRRWREALPVQYRPEPDLLVDTKIYRTIAILHLEYFNLLRAIHWNLISLASAENNLLGNEDLRRIHASEMVCLGAARSFIKTLNDIADECAGRRVFIVGLHIHQHMAALTVIYRGICKKPQRMSAKTDLEHFRAGKQHLERDIFSVNLSSTMKSVFNAMLGILEKLVS